MKLTDHSYQQRSLVGKWLRTRAEHEEKLAERYRFIMAAGDVQKLFYQLAADAEHSALLIWLFEGNELLPEPPPVSHGYPSYPPTDPMTAVEKR